MSIRNIALENIIRILEEKKPLHKVLADSLASVREPRDRAFLSRLVRGCVERAFCIDIVIDKISSVKVRKQKPVIRNILRCGVYQILFMDSVTDFAACDESVKLTCKRGLKNLRGFVNGVLRNVCRKKEEILNGLNKPGRDNYPYVYSLPVWIVEDFCNKYGTEASERAFEYFLKENNVSVRINTSKISCVEFESRFHNIFDTANKTEFEKKQTNQDNSQGYDEKNIKCFLEKSDYITGCYTLSGAGSIEELEMFNSGLFVVQDMSSVLVGYCAGNLKKLTDSGNKRINESWTEGISDLHVLDLCAAPGGKSLHLADLGAKVVACDITEQKTSLIKEAAQRCGFDNISVRINDATVYNREFDGRFDTVICDLPCSGLGIIGKKPDIKYNVGKEKIMELAALQKVILKNAVRYVKKDGFLIYSTCTVSDAENTENVEFLENELGLNGIKIKELLPKGIEPKDNNDCFIQLLPGEYDSDGFFISVFKK